MDQNDESLGIKFDTDTEATNSYQAVKYYKETTSPKMIRWVIKSSGGSITEKQAEYVLLGFVVVAIGISLFLFFGAGASQKTFPKPSDAMLEQMKNMGSLSK